MPLFDLPLECLNGMYLKRVHGPGIALASTPVRQPRCRVFESIRSGDLFTFTEKLNSQILAGTQRSRMEKKYLKNTEDIIKSETLNDNKGLYNVL